MNLPNTNNITLTIMNLLNANSLTLIIATLIYGISVITLTTAISKKAKTEKQFWAWHTPAAITLAIAYVALTTAVLPEKNVVDLMGTPLCIAAAFIVTHISLPIFSDDVLNINPKHLRVWGEPALITVLGAGIGAYFLTYGYTTPYAIPEQHNGVTVSTSRKALAPTAGGHYLNITSDEVVTAGRYTVNADTVGTYSWLEHEPNGSIKPITLNINPNHPKAEVAIIDDLDKGEAPYVQYVPLYYVYSDTPASLCVAARDSDCMPNARYKHDRIEIHVPTGSTSETVNVAHSPNR